MAAFGRLAPTTHMAAKETAKASASGAILVSRRVARAIRPPAAGRAHDRRRSASHASRYCAAR